jgi:hypothetical protein
MEALDWMAQVPFIKTCLQSNITNVMIHIYFNSLIVKFTIVKANVTQLLGVVDSMVSKSFSIKIRLQIKNEIKH